MRRMIVFSGPSLPPSAIRPAPGLEWRPPLKQGDLYRAALDQPDTICVIDGYFETTPTVWHQEILFALEKGIEVYGAASTGALRAAELDGYGMKGVGRIYEWYRDGILEDDDEVALLHAPPELDFIPLTEAMVNVRASVGQMITTGRISARDGRLLIDAAKAIFYKDRTWERILASDALTAAEDCRIDQKRADSLLLLETILAAED